MTSTRAAMRASSRSRGGSSSMHLDRMARLGAMLRVVLGQRHAGQRMHLERAHQPHQIGRRDALGGARIDARAA